ncbi:unnamed protein product [Mytilus edulis]|uniref:Uncharacterized protein n=1 Tax=Mytilus edulis TaxID=6550 RepID=A0A8S3RBQ3_MYTED|nr:unnamed protein product [Mytilus edulis]
MSNKDLKKENKKPKKSKYYIDLSRREIKNSNIHLKKGNKELKKSNIDLKKGNKELKKGNKDFKLEINNEEKSSIHRENKELKNILLDKVSEVKRLETRLEEYAAELEGIPSLKSRIEHLQTDNAELEKRLNEAAGNKLRDNNPNIADLSDINRPTSLAEKFSSLYTDEYTDAIEVIMRMTWMGQLVGSTFDWLKKCYEWCQRLAKEQRETLINRSRFMENHGVCIILD